MRHAPVARRPGLRAGAGVRVTAVGRKAPAVRLAGARGRGGHAAGGAPDARDVGRDWDCVGVEFDEEAELRAETRKIVELPELPISATCVRVPVLVGHAEAVWVETQEPLAPERARELLGAAPGV